MYKVD